ncbi:hypothetical protein I0Q91_00355 [Halanaerobiaceae bacterium Z-7014]|uniref:DNA helicase n=1 Tax=Halonatronomonas betaini TaxID=2778430 RepID=A0A931ASA7_9FIRM|nr:hypothetical protein [Halonatronomonas betaini]MBF8435515.1 hypothetical protein [Halonatronomonas betaini]
MNLDKHDKLLVNSLKNKLTEENILLLDVNPLKIKDGEYHILILNNKLIFLKRLNFDSLESFIQTVKFFLKDSQKNDYKRLKQRLNNHRQLVKDKNNQLLRFDIQIKYYLPDFNIKNYEYTKLNKEIKYFLDDCIFQNEFRKIITNPQKEFKVSNDQKIITHEMKKVILQKLSPEYTISKPNIGEIINHSNTDDKDYYVKSNDRIANIYTLDEEQINIINNISKGNQLLLACAGSGKSVLLLSKCFKAASKHPDRKFLLTCYNVNLKNYYEWQIEVAGFREKNVECITFLALCKRLIKNNKLKYNGKRDDFDKIFETVKKALKEGKINERYFGIFIDEVQIFKSEWYKFCFNLLENKNSNDHLFVVCGDLSQRVKLELEQGKAPWQGDEKLPDFNKEKNIIRIEKNYRNTKQINDYINSFIGLARNCLSRLRFKHGSEDLFLRGKAFREGELPKILELKNYNNKSEAKMIIKEIDCLIKKGVSISEIAVVMFHKQFRSRTGIPNWEDRHYNIFNPLIRLLHNNKYSHTILFDYGNELRSDYAERKGINLISSEGALGLDFDAVILCGLKPMGLYHNTKDAEIIFDKSNPVDERLEIEKNFHENITTLYTSCTRARNYLSIILPETIDESIYSYLLKKAKVKMSIK